MRQPSTQTVQRRKEEQAEHFDHQANKDEDIVHECRASLSRRGGCRNKKHPKYWLQASTTQVYYCVKENMYRYPHQQQSFYRLPPSLTDLSIRRVPTIQMLRNRIPSLRLVLCGSVVAEDGTITEEADDTMGYYAIEAYVHRRWFPVSGVYRSKEEFSRIFERNQSHLRKLLQDMWTFLV